ncbi:MAG TPA: methyltransferase domain-containing protein [Vicinamibacterales bacterium]|jgi:SAM-dependent methyltransferase
MLRLALIASFAAFAPNLAPVQLPPRLPQPDVRYVPTPQNVVEAMLDLAHVTSADVVYDLGSGDGRIPITAAQKYGARGVGIEIDAFHLRDAYDNLKKAGVGDRVQFLNQDLFASDISEATVVTLFLLPQVNERLKPKLQRELRPGTRVVSHLFRMGDDWPPEQSREIDGTTIYLWTIRGKDRLGIRDEG